MRRWTATYRFRFTPVISFERRRANLLDWVESNLEPVAFRDEEDEVGIALRRGVRMRIARQSLALEDSAAASDGVGSLWPAVEGFLQTMEPREISLSLASIGWSFDLEGRNYTETAMSMAERVTGITSPLASGARLKDFASMIDAESDTLRMQAEFGIVSPPELRERLTNSNVGKVKARPNGAFPPSAFDGLPATSMFVDTAVFSRSRTAIEDLAGMQAAVTEFDTAAKELADAIVTSATTEKETVR